MNNRKILHSSYRDPSGFVYTKRGIVYRQVNFSYRTHYDRLMRSGLYQELVDAQLLIPHTEIKQPEKSSSYKLIRPLQVPFISYPYEWCFSQLKAAALNTLELQLTALKYGMSLKDASAYNTQFISGKPVHIDTLSFEAYREGMPWVAYRQFCEQFLAPLTLMSKRTAEAGRFMMLYPEGIPLPIVTKLLPITTWRDLGLLSHLYLHARSQTHFVNRQATSGKLQVSKSGLTGLLGSLRGAVSRLIAPTPRGGWVDYYQESSTQSQQTEKQKLVLSLLKGSKYRMVWDLGANTGVFSRLISPLAGLVVAIDSDPDVVEKNYQLCQAAKVTNVLPLLIDLTNPSPALGWENRERFSLIERGPADLVLVLALIHHLAIGHNLPFGYISSFLKKIARKVVIEFVPKEDPQVQKMLTLREDIFGGYTQKEFEREFEKYFRITDQKRIPGSSRILYVMERK